MKRTTWILAASIALVLWGCDDGRGDGDAGGIVLMDSGPGGGTDSGPGETDAGPGANMCAVTSAMPLPMACFPRCSNATLVAANNCASAMDPAMCQQMAFDADTTPPTTLMAGTQSIELDCAACVGWQQDTCLAEQCPSEFMALVQCRQAMTGTCDTETMALNSCIMANMATLNTCAGQRATPCFDQTMGGFLPVEPRQLDVHLWSDWTPAFDYDPSFFPTL